jgi:adenine-specific DNA-methyltransferase
MPPEKRAVKAKSPRRAENYQHPDADSPMRPEAGTQAQFKKKKPPQAYRYDSSLSPALEWDGQNPGREQGEAALRETTENLEKLTEAFNDHAMTTQDGDATKDPVIKALSSVAGCLEKLKALSRPFLNWSGKAERLSFDVPTLPLFIHLAGTISASFAGGEHGQVAVKVIDQRGNELLVVKSLKEAAR